MQPYKEVKIADTVVTNGHVTNLRSDLLGIEYQALNRFIM